MEEKELKKEEGWMISYSLFKVHDPVKSQFHKA